ncbi:MAG: DUF3050 domain-containing protein [Planctomycetes bacterium]|nr:DUF3050 domain-containing protein [Planctomycetota bacterium]
MNLTETTSSAFAGLQRRLQPLRERLLTHPVYGALRTPADLHTFLGMHVFAVWDFMSLLKALQRRLTCVDEVWRPTGDVESRRLVNEIVLGEESDEVGGGFTSHFELYLGAIRQAGGSTAAIDEVLRRLDAGDDVARALAAAPEAARRFSMTTFEIVRSGSLPAIAAAFTLGREDVIPAMFTELLRDLRAAGAADTSILIDYLDRHVELDGDQHGPMAARLLARVCGADPAAWRQATAAAESSLRARLALWDGVLAALPAVAATSVRPAAR